MPKSRMALRSGRSDANGRDAPARRRIHACVNLSATVRSASALASVMPRAFWKHPFWLLALMSATAHPQEACCEVKVPAGLAAQWVPAPGVGGQDAEGLRPEAGRAMSPLSLGVDDPGQCVLRSRGIHAVHRCPRLPAGLPSGGAGRGGPWKQENQKRVEHGIHTLFRSWGGATGSC